MKQQILIIIIAITAVVIIVGGYATWTLLNSNQSNNLEATPSPTATASPEPSASPEDTAQSQVRDASVNYINSNHSETIQLTTDLSWTGGRQETGLLGSETYVYTSTGWVVTIKYPVVANPTYTVTANYSSGEASVMWQGTFQDQTVTETSYLSNINGLPAQLSIQEQVRDATMAYIETNHPETAQLMIDLSWTGGRQETGLLGAETYIYNSTSWIVTIHYPVVQNPIYSVNASFCGTELSVDWQGTYEGGAIAETSYVASNLSVLSTQEQVRDAIMVYIEANHNETTQYMQSLSWTGGRATPAMLVGSETYIYQTIGWNVTMQYPVVLDPTYTVTAKYTSPVSQITPEQIIVDWQGIWQNGTITETGYVFNP